jgi:SPP1 family predicted phage head-tail adaptor
MTRAGRLDRRIDIERKTVTHAPSGQPIETWAPLVSRRSASVTPLSGDERFSAPQYVAREQVQFEIRWSPDVASVQPKDRIVYPAVDTSVSPAPVPAERDIYDIIYVAEIGRRRGLRIVAARRADVS